MSFSWFSGRGRFRTSSGRQSAQGKSVEMTVKRISQQAADRRHFFVGVFTKLITNTYSYNFNNNERLINLYFWHDVGKLSWGSFNDCLWKEMFFSLSKKSLKGRRKGKQL